ncbi:MAG: methionyl-tRNA formyltransferase [Bacteroidia bacterium]
MRIYIITMEDPVYTLDFFKDIIRERHGDIVGLTLAKGDRLKIGKKRSKLIYVASLLLIMGPLVFAKHSLTTVWFKLRKKMSRRGICKNPSIAAFASDYKIPVSETDNPNAKEFLEYLKSLNIDIIINQSQFIIKKELLAIPKIGVLNRHNALLPKNRGRLTPFWVKYKNETETGVSIHFVDEGIDSGKIVVQEKFDVTPKDTFNSIVRKNYQIASKAMLKAIALLEVGTHTFMENDDALATYNTVPTFREALRYRMNQFIS